MRNCIEFLLHKFDIKKFTFIGGSHGGFIGAWLSVKYSEVFSKFQSSFVLRNPVVNLLSMSSQTDIPDWCFEECGISYLSCSTPTKEEFEVLYSCSPVCYSSHANDSLKFTKTLLLLGALDKRVPNSQGLEIINNL